MSTLFHQPGYSVGVSQTSEYALRAVVFLAAREEIGPVSAQEIAEATKVPTGYLQKVLRMLARRGILHSQRGSGGGFSLAKLASAISVNDVLRATESGISRIDQCPLGLKGHTRLCALHRLLDQQIALIDQTFSATSIGDLLASDNGHQPLCDSLQTNQQPTIRGRKKSDRA